MATNATNTSAVSVNPELDELFGDERRSKYSILDSILEPENLFNWIMTSEGQ